MTETLLLIAPNMQAQVQRTIDEHPEIDTLDEEARGEVIDITDWRVNGGRDRPWGRKARNNDPNNPNLNTDGMTYLRPDGLFEIYDCISGTDGSATWIGWGPYAPGENGYWWPPQPSASAPPVETLASRLEALEAQVADLVTHVEGQDQHIADLDAALAAHLAAPFRAHGPVDLPIVLESLTSLRCIGDIDVEIKPGIATPPAVSESPARSPLATAIALRRLLHHGEAPEEPAP